MFIYPDDSYFYFSKEAMLSTSKLHALDEYWSKRKSHLTHQKRHEIIEYILIMRGEKTLKQERLNHIISLEKSFLISNPLGRLSANIIGFAYKILLSKNFIKSRNN
tara:strand:+ start:265 stop:582 length:318 start_codon:yes stop_codon:yes gene_type:complete